MKAQFGPLGEIVFRRTYARIKPDGRKETFSETMDRCLKAFNTQLGCGFTSRELDELNELFHGMKGSVAGRFLWQLGTPTVEKYGLLSLQNCAHVAVNDPIQPFVWAFDALMLGCGVGANVQREFVYEIPRVLHRPEIKRQDTADADFIVPDSRQGWIELLRRTLEAFFNTGESFTYSTVLVRPAGSPIKSFGGVASGPDSLCQGIEWIVRVLQNRHGKKLRSVDVGDILNIIGWVVVSGNVRRSAEILQGDVDDLLFSGMKTWSKGIPSWRAMSNNTFIANSFENIPPVFFDQLLSGDSEVYGLFNLKNAREFGRAGDYSRTDPRVTGSNPCSEQSLEPWETCCLGETFLSNCTNYEEFAKISKYLYRINKHSLTLPCHWKQTEDVVHRNMRMGIGASGIMQATKEQLSWLSPCYEELLACDHEYSAKNGFPESIKLTTIKPSGTLSKVAGVSEGASAAWAEYMQQRITFASNSDMLPALGEAGYKIEQKENFDGSIDPAAVYACIPCHFPNARTVDDVTAIDQLETVKMLQTEWSDNCVSNTISYKPGEEGAIRDWLKEHYDPSIKSLSFLRTVDNGFKQLPKTKITREQYEAMKAPLKPIQWESDVDETVDLGLECSGGVCPLR